MVSCLRRLELLILEEKNEKRQQRQHQQQKQRALLQQGSAGGAKVNHARGKGGILGKEAVSSVGRAGTLAGSSSSSSSSGGGGGGGISQRQLAVVEVKLQVGILRGIR